MTEKEKQKLLDSIDESIACLHETRQNVLLNKFPDFMAPQWIQLLSLLRRKTNSKGPESQNEKTST